MGLVRRRSPFYLACGPSTGRKGVVFLSVGVDPREDIGRLKAYVEENGITWIIGRSSEAGEAYRVTAIPTIVIVDGEGQVAVRHTGFVSEQQLSKMLDSLLKG